ncbi:response regulator [Salinimicrobium xinjiangense]|uniref:response regulator n=1 Tax=Salinimicrobium xinjiangense TaxID=438596 RepID=UPI00040A3136|nr:response regulator [Salinimicrobium xinjiangense]
MLKTDSQTENLPEILILEDDLIIAKLQEYLVEKVCRRSPLIFKNGKEAIDYLDTRTERERDILVLLDINMPIMNGWEFMEACEKRAYKFQIHVVIVTSSLFKEDCEKAKQFDGIIGYYTKPLKKEDMQEIMKLKK